VANTLAKTNKMETKKKKPNVIHPKLTKEQEELVYQMLMGPYLPEWKINGTVQNSDQEIADRMQISVNVVILKTTHIMSKHFDRVTKLRNEIDWITGKKIV